MPPASRAGRRARAVTCPPTIARKRSPAAAGRVAANLRRAVEVAIGALRGQVGTSAVGVVEDMRREHALRRHLVELAVIAAITTRGNAIKIAVLAQQWGVIRNTLISNGWIRVSVGEVPQRGQCSSWSKLEHRSGAIYAASLSGSIVIAVGTESDAALRDLSSLGAGRSFQAKIEYLRICAGGRHFINRTGAVSTVGLNGAVDLSIQPLDENPRPKNTGVVSGCFGVSEQWRLGLSAGCRCQY